MQLNSIIKQTTAAAILFGLIGAAHALTFEPFTEARFKALQAANQPILIDINAKWCSTCKSQGLVLDSYQRQHPNSGITALKVDFDSQKRWVNYFKAPRQSTFVAFKGTEQIGFSVAETRANEIFKQLDALSKIPMSKQPAATNPSPVAVEEAPKRGFFQRLFQGS